MLVVNLFGAPSSGKSTCASMVFTALKMARANVELVTEYAKEKTWEGNEPALSNQAYMFGCQCYRLSMLRDKVDIIITDSPLPLSILYNHDPVLGEDFNRTVMNVFNSYENLNYFLTRATKYDPVGRWQTEEESDAVSQELLKLLDTYCINVEHKAGKESGYREITEEVLRLCEDRGYIRQM